MIFLDTEFTDLLFRPRLLSVGLVAVGEPDREFYAEVTDPDRLDEASRFARDAVLPQFGKLADAACSYATLGARLASFLGSVTAALRSDESVGLAFGYHLDWELVEEAIEDAGSPHWESTKRRLRPVNVYELTGFGVGKLATEAYFKAQAGAPFSRHHALCDARALRLACEAASTSFAIPGPAAARAPHFTPVLPSPGATPLSP